MTHRHDRHRAARHQPHPPLTQRYLDRCRRGLASIMDAVDHANFAAAERLGHEMAGSGDSFGFPPISSQGRTIVDAARQKQSQPIRQAVSALDAYLKVVTLE